MSIEEKAKAYDEALEKAKFYHGNCPSEPERKKLEKMFPVLRESEDERIRKQLINICNEWLSGGHSARPCLNDVRWLKNLLEKQKEQNDQDEECTDFTIYHPLKNGKGKYECIPYSFYGSLTSFSEDKDLIDFLRTCFYTEEECEAWIEKQKEQKPAEWSEEDKLHYANILEALEYVKGCKSDYDKIEAIKSDIAWLKSLRPQPREEIYQSAKHDLAIKFMNYLDENRPEGKMSLSNGECEDIDKAFKENDWAKIMRYVEKYRPQPKQEPSEEEIEEMVNERATKSGTTKSEMDFYRNGIKDAIKRFNLRPPFKPSDHQMNILKAVKEYVGRGSGYWGEGLGSLIEDLEKLM